MFSAQAVLWSAAALLIYTYAGYPLLIWLWAGFCQRQPRQGNAEPRLSILVVAYNEARLISSRIENLLTLDYPGELVEIVIASDAATDGTAELARRYRSDKLRVVEFHQRRGKAAVLNELIPQLQGELVVLMDVRQRIEQGALRTLLANFADPRIGAVSGELILHRGTGSSELDQGVDFYWRYEKFIRLNESRVDSTVGATGAFYAIRKRLFCTIPAAIVLEDVLIPMLIVRQGYRVLFEPLARAHDRIAPSADAEFKRKTRTIAGNFQLLCHESWLLNPLRNRLWFQTVSHKLCRLLGPVLLVAVLASNLLLLDSAFYCALLLLQVLFYASATAGHIGRNVPGQTALTNIAYAFCLLNWATVVGCYRFARGRQPATWQKAQS